MREALRRPLPRHFLTANLTAHGPIAVLELSYRTRCRTLQTMLLALILAFAVHRLRACNDHPLDRQLLCYNQLIQQRCPDRINAKKRAEIRQIVLIRSEMDYAIDILQRVQEDLRITNIAY